MRSCVRPPEYDLRHPKFDSKVLRVYCSIIKGRIHTQMQIKIASEYKRDTAVFRLRTVLRKYFPPAPAERPLDVVDCVETAAKQAMPGFRIRVEVTRIATGNGNGSGGQH